MRTFRRFGMPVGAALLMLHASNGMLAAADPPCKVANGLAVYLRIVPAEMVKGSPLHSAEQPMHGTARAPNEFHVLAAIFDAAAGARVSDARVAAQVSSVALSGAEKTLEPIEIAGRTTHGSFFDLPSPDLYTVKLTIERPSGEALHHGRNSLIKYSGLSTPPVWGATSAPRPTPSPWRGSDRMGQTCAAQPASRPRRARRAYRPASAAC